MQKLSISKPTQVVLLALFLALLNAGFVAAQGSIASSAIAGKPFGVGHISVPIGPGDEDSLPRIFIRETSDRVFYPAIVAGESDPPQVVRQQPPSGGRRIGGGALVQRLKSAIETARQQSQPFLSAEIDFLFTGDQPLEIWIEGLSTPPQRVALAPSPTASAGTSDLLKPNLQRWYSTYAAAAIKQLAAGDYAPVFQTFMVETMARRLELQPISLRPENSKSPSSRDADPLVKPQSTLELLASTEAIRDQMLQQTLRKPARQLGQKNVALPQPPIWNQQPVAPTPDDLPIESIATAVPDDCFYLRFGRFANYLWFRTLSTGKGAGLGQMMTIRGTDSFANARIEKMLATKATLLAKLFGDAIIGDMAIIGNDLYLQDGASMGVLFEARNVAQLQSSIDSERKQFAKSSASEGVQLDTLQISGRPVTLLSNRDHTIRSFRVVEGNRLLICTSQNLVERFLAVQDGASSLAQSAEFRYGRLLMPLQNEYELFGYFPSKMFQRLVSPQYNIELRRRYAAKARIAAVEMASLMAAAENVPVTDVDSLVDAGYLPPWFNDSGDGSQIVRDGERWVDSRRGGLGGFLPVTDVPLLDCTAEEAELYEQDAAFYSNTWKSTEPLMFGLRRFESPLGPAVERLAIEAHVTSFQADKLGTLGRYLAPPVDTIIATPPDDMVSIQVHTAGQNILGSHSPDNVLFAGLKDSLPPQPTKEKRLLEIWRAVSHTPFYLGAWPSPGYLDQLPLGLGGSRPDLNGYSRALLGMWRWQGSGFSVVSFDRSLLDQAVAYVQPVIAPDPAQVRLLVRDLERSQLAGWVNTFWYRRSFAASRGNLRLLDAMQQQFHLSPEAALASSQYLLDTRLVCPLGGQYKPEITADTPSSRWANSALTAGDVMRVDLESLYAPPDYQADWIGWMRGLQAHVTQTSEGLTLIATADVQRQEDNLPASEPMALPPLNFDLFNLPSMLFGGSKPETVPEKEQRSF